MLGRMLDANRALVPAAVLAPPLAVFAPKGLSVVLSATALLALVSLIRQGRLLDIVRSRTALILALALAWALLSFFWAVDPAKVPGRAGQLALLFFAVLVTLAVSRGARDDQRILEKPLIVGVVTGGALLLWELASNGTLDRLAHEMLGLDGDWHPFSLNSGTAIFLILTWPVMFLLRQNLAALGAVLAVALAVTVLAVSTTAKAAFACGVIVFLLSYAFRTRAIAAAAALAAILVLATPLVSATVLTPDRVEAVFPELKHSGLHRLIMWQFASRRIAEKPIAGWGLGASRALPGGDEIIPKAEARGLSTARFLTLHPHNWAVQAWLELGLPGAAMLAALVWLAFRGTARYFPDRTAQACAAAAATTALVFTMSSWSLWQAWWISALALCAALVSATCRTEEASAP